jgi:hypothetical protein
MPRQQYNDRSAYIFLAICQLKENDPWSRAKSEFQGVTEQMGFIREHYSIDYKPNTRETVRKDTIHQFRDAGIIEDNNQPTNSPNFAYRLTDEMLKLVKSYGKSSWKNELKAFLSNHETLTEIYRQKREAARIPVKINGRELKFSPSAHNQLQKNIIEDFGPVFAPDATVSETLKRKISSKRLKNSEN